MIGVLIGEGNKSQFLQILSDEIRENCDLFIGAVDDETDTACGVMAVQAAENHTLAIRFLYVDENYRRKGAACAMLDFLYELALDSGAKEIVCSYIRENNNVLVDSVFEKCGYTENELVRTSMFRMKTSSFRKQLRKMNTKMCILKHFPKEMWKQVLAAEKKTIPMGGIMVSKEEHYDENLSFIAYSDSRKPIGGFFVSKIENKVVLERLFAVGSNSKQTLYDLLQKGVNDLTTSLSPETEVWINVYDDAALAIIKYISDNKAEKFGDCILQSRRVVA